MIPEDSILRKLIAFGERDDFIRVILLTSSRANPNAPRDILSDYDVEIYTNDVVPFGASDAWFEAFGPVLVVFREEPDQARSGGYTRLVQYEDGSRIDFGIAHVDQLKKTCALPSLPDDYDNGYMVLLDKDGVTASLKPPTYKAFIPTVPTEAEYATQVNDFWWDSTYVSKYLWRDDLLGAKFMLDDGLVQHQLRTVLEWSIEIERGWSWRPGHFGRGLTKMLDPETRKEFAGIYAGGDIEELWESLSRTTALYRRVAIRVGSTLGYQYPHDLDRRVTAFHQAVRGLDRNATSLEELSRRLRESLKEL